MKKCEYCGNSIKDNETTCPHCGGFSGAQDADNINENKAEENIPESANKTRKVFVIFVAVLAVAILVLFIFMAVNIFKRGNAIYKKASEGLENKISVSYFVKE